MAAMSSSTAASPSRREMAGVLFQYAAGRQAFESSPGLSKKLIVLGGLSDGLLSCDYVPILAAAVAAQGWGTVQPVLRSSYTQFGFGSLDTDVEDLEALVRCLRDERGASAIGLVGHSTGSQIAAHFVRTGAEDAVRPLTHVVFQAGVSDRETDDVNVEEKHAEMLDVARRTPPEEFLPRDATWAPITAQRFIDLYARNGRDDYFSSDLAEEDLDKNLSKFGHLGIHALVAFSGADEYMPKTVDPTTLAKRLCAAMRRAAPTTTSARYVGCVVQGANHALGPPTDDPTNLAHARAFVETVRRFLAGDLDTADGVPGVHTFST